jgi:hypothetical protein
MFREVETVRADPSKAAELLDALSPSLQLSRALELIENHASQAEQRSNVPRNREYADKLRTHIKLLRAMIRDGGSKEAIAMIGLSLGQLWMQLRVDAHASAAMKAHRDRVPKSTVTDQQVLRAVKETSTKTAAAEKLGISTRQLQNRLREIRKQ